MWRSLGTKYRILEILTLDWHVHDKLSDHMQCMFLDMTWSRAHELQRESEIIAMAESQY